MARDYTALVTSEHAKRPKFMARVALTTGAMAQASDAALALPGAFSVDSAIGAQLDRVGLWVGVSRKQTIPVPNAFFSWNTVGKGWNQANWKGPLEPTEGILRSAVKPANRGTMLRVDPRSRPHNDAGLEYVCRCRRAREIRRSAMADLVRRRLSEGIDRCAYARAHAPGGSFVDWRSLRGTTP